MGSIEYGEIGTPAHPTARGCKSEIFVEAGTLPPPLLVLKKICWATSLPGHEAFGPLSRPPLTCWNINRLAEASYCPEAPHSSTVLAARPLSPIPTSLS